MKDYLGTEIAIGQRAVRVHSSGHYKSFAKITIMQIDETRIYGDTIGFITDGNNRIVWTFPYRIIVQDSIKVQI